MEIRKKYNPLTGTYEYYNIITHEWVTGNGNEITFGQVTSGRAEGIREQSGLGIIDSLASVAAKVATKATSDVAKKVTESALESASKKAGDELGKYAVERIKDKVTRQGAKRPSAVPTIDSNLIVKELQKMDTSPPPSPPKRLYRGGKLKKNI